MVTYWDMMPSPLGFLYMVVTEQGQLCRVSWGETAEHVFEKAHDDGAVHEPDRLEAVRNEMQAYFDGGLHRFTVPITIETLTPFQKRVLEVIRGIPYGHVMTYKDVAVEVRSPLAARAVGQALGRNPMAIVIPCHRVVGHNGHMGGFSAPGGVATKQWLLKHEGALSELPL